MAQRKLVRLSPPLIALLIGWWVMALPAAAQDQEGTESGSQPRDADVTLSTGAASLRIPIDVPMGTGGFQPELVLHYSSHTGDGIFGVGWQLSLGEIRRADRFGTPAFAGSDPLELDGELLVTDGTTWRTITEKFTRILLDQDGFEAVFLNGHRARFGISQATRIGRDPTQDTGPGNPTARWLLEELIDESGNTIRFAYDRSIHPGTAYPSEITYSYQSNAPVGERRRVRLLYEDRPDVGISFRGGVPSVLSKRVREIQAYVDTAPVAVHRRRTFRYSATSDGYTTHRSRLVGTTLYGSDCTELASPPGAGCSAMPEQTMVYTDPDDAMGSEEEGAFWEPVDEAEEDAWDIPVDVQDGVRLGDVDGDGRLDLVKALVEGGSEAHGVYLNKGSGWSHDVAWSNRLRDVQFDSWYLADGTNGTPCGFLDKPGSRVLFQSNDSFVDPDKWDSDGKEPAPVAAELVDLNGDGLADLVVAFQAGPVRCWGTDEPPRFVRKVFLNTGSSASGQGWVLAPDLSTSFPAIMRTSGLEKANETICNAIPNDSSMFDRVKLLSNGAGCVATHSYPTGTRFADLNGDRRPDLLARRDGTYPTLYPDYPVGEADGAWINTEDGWVALGAGYAAPVPLEALASGIPSDTGTRLVDINGDGLTDLVKRGLDQILHLNGNIDGPAFLASGVWLNTGSGWCAPASCPLASRYLPPTGFVAEWEDTFGPGAGQWSHYVRAKQLQLVDVNGDGLLDLMQTFISHTTWLHDPSAPGGFVWVSDERFTHGQDTFNGLDTGVRVADFDGNGTPDVVMIEETSGSPSPPNGAPAPLLSRAAAPDRVARYANGRGASFEFEYTSAIVQRDDTTWDEDEDLEATAEADEDSLEPSGTGIVRWAARPVVSKLTVDVGASESPGPPYRTEFVYARPKWCPLLESGLGFRMVETERDDGSTARTFFYQAHGRAGQRSKAEIREAGNLLLRSTWSWEVVGGEAVPGSIAGAHVGRLVQEQTAAQYAGGTAGATRTVGYLYDGPDAGGEYGYNFVEQIDIIRPTGTITVHRTATDPSATNWIVARLAEETHESGGIAYRIARYEYDSQGRRTKVHRDIQSRASQPVFVGTATTSWSYDAWGNVTLVIDPKGRTRSFCYDGDTILGSSGLCPPMPTATHALMVGLRDPLGAVSEFERRITTGDIMEVHRFNGDRSRVDLDAFDRPRSIFVEPEGGSETRLEERLYVDLPNQGKTSVEVREFLSAEPAAPYTWTRIYADGLGRRTLEEYATPNGSAGRRFLYDYAGRVLSETYDGVCVGSGSCSSLATPGEPGTPPPEVEYRYDALGRLMSRDSPDGLAIASYRRDVRDALDFDLVLLKGNDGTLTQRLLDGDRVAWVDECANTVSPGEGNPGNLSCTGADRTHTTYEPTGEVSTLYDAVATATASYTNDRHRLVYLYDTLGRVTEIRDPDGGLRRTSYDFVGNIASVINARNQTTVYTHDALDRLIRVNHPGTTVDSVIEYDPHSRQRSLLRKEDGSQSNFTVMSHEYDAFGRESRRILWGIPSLVADFEYDLLGRVTRIQYPSPDLDVSYQYAGGYLVSVCGGPNASACTSDPDKWFLESVAYDGIGRVTSMETKDVGAPAPPAHELAYDPETYRLANLAFLNGYHEPLVDLRYEYDPQGRVTSVADDAVTGSLDASADYAYDHRGRLRSWIWQGSEQHFRYDSLGNLTHRSVDSASAPANQVYDHPTRPHAITQRLAGGVPDTTYAYNPDGDMTQRGGLHYKYDADDRLTCAGSAPGACDAAQYSYTVDGELYAVKIGADNRLLLGDLYEWDFVTNTATAHVFALGREIAVRTSANATLREAWLPATWPLPIPAGPLGWGVGALAGAGLLVLLARAGAGAALARRPVRTAGAWLLALTFLPPNAWAGGGPPQFGNGGNTWARRWITHDHLGNAILYTDASGAVVHRRVFEPFGMIAAETPPTEPTERLFTGQRFEDEAGVYNFRARWYDAETGRFLSVDPILQDLGDPQTHNGYGYVRNDPVNLVDPTGAFFGLEIVAAVVAAILQAAFLGTVLYNALLIYNQTPLGELTGNGPSGDVSATDILLGDSVVLAQVNAPPEQPGGVGNETPESTASRADSVSYTHTLEEYGRILDAEDLPVERVEFGPVEMAFSAWSLVQIGRSLARAAAEGAARAATRTLDDLGSLRGASAKQLEDIIPKDFVKSQVRKGEGVRYADPARRGDQIRIMRGDPSAADPLHQGPYAVISRSGRVTRIPLEGNPTLP